MVPVPIAHADHYLGTLVLVAPVILVVGWVAVSIFVLSRRESRRPAPSAEGERPAKRRRKS